MSQGRGVDEGTADGDRAGVRPQGGDRTSLASAGEREAARPGACSTPGACPHPHLGKAGGPPASLSYCPRLSFRKLLTSGSSPEEPARDTRAAGALRPRLRKSSVVPTSRTSAPPPEEIPAPAPGSRNPRPDVSCGWTRGTCALRGLPPARLTLARLVPLRSELISVRSLPPAPVPARAGLCPPGSRCGGRHPHRQGLEEHRTEDAAPGWTGPVPAVGPGKTLGGYVTKRKSPACPLTAPGTPRSESCHSCPSSGRQRSPSGPEAGTLLCDRQRGTKSSDTKPCSSRERVPGHSDALRPGVQAAAARLCPACEVRTRPTPVRGREGPGLLAAHGGAGRASGASAEGSTGRLQVDTQPGGVSSGWGGWAGQQPPQCGATPRAPSPWDPESSDFGLRGGSELLTRVARQGPTVPDESVAATQAAT